MKRLNLLETENPCCMLPGLCAGNWSLHAAYQVFLQNTLVWMDSTANYAGSVRNRGRTWSDTASVLQSTN